MKDNISAEKDVSIEDYWFVLWRRKALIIVLVSVTVIATAIYSLFIQDIYEAGAVISPVSTKEGGVGNFSVLSQQFGSLPGISLPGSASEAEIVNLLRSNILREKIIVEHDLLPVLFHEKWDSEKKAWKGKKGGFLTIASILRGGKNPSADIPTIWDGLRMLNRIVKVSSNIKSNTITLSTEFHDPDVATRITEYFLFALTDHMSKEAQRVAKTNKKYLKDQLGQTMDPFIRQKIYNLIAQQIETSMMAEVKENFAFKVIDPPKAPDRKIRPRRSTMVTMSFVASFSAAACLAFFFEYLKRKRQLC